VKALRILGFSDMRPYKMNRAWHDFDPDGNARPWARLADAFLGGVDACRIICRVMEKNVYVLLIADGRRDMQALLERRLLKA
jgi:hypothetical protein